MGKQSIVTMPASGIGRAQPPMAAAEGGNVGPVCTVQEGHPIRRVAHANSTLAGVLMYCAVSVRLQSTTTRLKLRPLCNAGLPQCVHTSAFSGGQKTRHQPCSASRNPASKSSFPQVTNMVELASSSAFHWCQLFPLRRRSRQTVVRDVLRTPARIFNNIVNIRPGLPF